MFPSPNWCTLNISVSSVSDQVLHKMLELWRQYCNTLDTLVPTGLLRTQKLNMVNKQIPLFHQEEPAANLVLVLMPVLSWFNSHASKKPLARSQVRATSWCQGKMSVCNCIRLQSTHLTRKHEEEEKEEDNSLCPNGGAAPVFASLH